VNTEYTITIGTAFGHRTPVEVINRTPEHILIRLASGVEAWVKPTSLKREPKVEPTRLEAFVARQTGTDPVVDEGMYQHERDIYRVQRSKTSGNLYAKRLVDISGNRLSESDVVVNWEFQYDPGAIRTLRSSERMTLDQARLFGIQYGVCCVCGITLKDAKSVQAGIGPVCAKRV
jgi:hypothetical protein